MAWQLQLPIANDLYREAKRVVEDWLTCKPGEKLLLCPLSTPLTADLIHPTVRNNLPIIIFITAIWQ